MRLDGGGVDENLCRRTAGPCERLEQRRPHALFGPTDIAVVERFLRSVFERRINPSTARFEDMNNAADDASVIDARFAPRVGRQMRLNL